MTVQKEKPAQNKSSSYSAMAVGSLAAVVAAW
jgi:hypothetical protein